MVTRFNGGNAFCYQISKNSTRDKAPYPFVAACPNQLARCKHSVRFASVFQSRSTPPGVDKTRIPREVAMHKRARDVMTPSPACCTATTALDQVAKMMIQNDCGEIPVVDMNDRIIGVVTDRDIVCRVVADGKNPMAYTAETCMSQPVVTVNEDAPLEEVVATMEKHQIRRVPVVDAHSVCTGIISQADVAWTGPKDGVADLVREVSRDTGQVSR